MLSGGEQVLFVVLGEDGVGDSLEGGLELHKSECNLSY